MKNLTKSVFLILIIFLCACETKDYEGKKVRNVIQSDKIKLLGTIPPPDEVTIFDSYLFELEYKEHIYLTTFHEGQYFLGAHAGHCKCFNK